MNVITYASHNLCGYFLTHWGRDRTAAILQTTFSKAFSCKKIYEFRLIFHWCFIPKSQINNTPALVQIMAWRRPGNKPLSERMMVSLMTHLCVTRPYWVKRVKLTIVNVRQIYTKGLWLNTKISCCAINIQRSFCSDAQPKRNVVSHWLGAYTKWSLDTNPAYHLKLTMFMETSFLH